MIALIDCNNFYVSCERAFNPALNGRPVIVLSNNDGCAVSRSQEAKDLGVRMGQPLFELKALVAKHDIKVFSSNYALYGDMSRRVMNILASRSPELEIYSIDEAFANWEGIPNLQEHATETRSTLLQCLGLPVCVGVAPTKVLAKVANYWAKRRKELGGVMVLDSKAAIEQALRALPVGEVWGIGRSASSKLAAQGVTTAWDFTKLTESWVRKELTVTGARIWHELRGKPCITAVDEESQRKSVTTTRSFTKGISNPALLKERLANFAANCGSKLRKERLAAHVVTVFVRTDYFNKNQPQHSAHISTSLTSPTNNNMALMKTAFGLLEQIQQSGVAYKKAGIVLSGLVPEGHWQGDLFSAVSAEKGEALMRALDVCNSKFGKQSVRMAIQGNSNLQLTTQQQLSPQYTTRWDDFLEITTLGVNEPKVFTA